LTKLAAGMTCRKLNTGSVGTIEKLWESPGGLQMASVKYPEWSVPVSEFQKNLQPEEPEFTEKLALFYQANNPKQLSIFDLLENTPLENLPEGQTKSHRCGG